VDPLAQAALSSWSIDPWLAAGLAAAALCYARGWRRLHRESPRRFGPFGRDDEFRREANRRILWGRILRGRRRREYDEQHHT